MSFQVDNPEIKKAMQSVGRYLRAKLPVNLGYTLLMHSVGEGGSTFYISSIEREDSYAAMKEFLVEQGVIPKEEEKKVEGVSLPPEVKRIQDAATILVTACVQTNAPTMLLKLGGRAMFGLPDISEWEIYVRRKK